MFAIALKMLVEDKAKFLGMVLSLSFSSLIIMQQMAIFIGLMQRTYSVIADTPQAKIWVMNPSVKMIDDINPTRDIDLYRIRSIDGVEWAMPFFKSPIRARLPNGHFEICTILGVDAATFIGGPYKMLAGKIEDLREPHAVIIDTDGAFDKLATRPGPGMPKIPLKLGDIFELNDRRAKVVGICKITKPFLTQPVIYTTYKRALEYAPFERKLLSFILVHPKDGVDEKQLCTTIQRVTGLAAYTKKEFENKTVRYYLENTGIPVNFGIAVALGILVGAAIAGQIFFNFVTDNLRYFALFCTFGASRRTLASITLLQATYAGLIGWGIGSGLAALIGFLSRDTQLAFYLPWQIWLGTGLLILIICAGASLINIRRIYNIQLSTMFK
ncbi:ABC transporter permease [Candidatus Dependentiae bacterium Noda2021]|nr:ABC transporter permease [Candidatus Dependentiae bacterium Noda2021]